MSVAEYITYQKFNDYDTAQEFSTLLRDNHVDYSLEDTSLQFDSFFSNKDAVKEYTIKIKQEDFLKVDQLLLQDSTNNINANSEEHYLVHFTNDELYEIIAKRSEWSSFDFQFAQKLLKDRGQEIKKETLDHLEVQRLIALSKPQKLGKGWIYIGYISSVLGGLFGVIIGWHIFTYKKPLPDGSKIYNYEQPDRRNGKIIFTMGICVFVICLILKTLQY